MRTFISRTFREDEKTANKIADYIEELAVEAGLQPVKVIPKGGDIVLEQVLSEMKTCRAYLGIFTKREKLAADNFWTIPPSVLMEMAMARALNLTIAGFIDDEISRSRLGIIGMEGWQILDFNRKTMFQPAKRKEFVNYLSSLKQEFPKPSNPHRFIRFLKEVEIRPSGYAVVSHKCRLKIINEDFKQFVHMITLGDNAGKEVKFPSFDKLANATPNAYWSSRPFFSFRLLDPIDHRISESDVKIEPLDTCNDETIEFAIRLAKPLSDIIVNYEWSIGMPDMFPTKRSDLMTKGARKKDSEKCFSYLRLGHGPIDDFSYHLIFFRGAEFEASPSLKIYDGSENLMSIGGSFDLEKRTTKNLFNSTTLNTELLTTGRIVAEWIPK